MRACSLDCVRLAHFDANDDAVALGFRPEIDAFDHLDLLFQFDPPRG